MDRRSAMHVIFGSGSAMVLLAAGAFFAAGCNGRAPAQPVTVPAQPVIAQEPTGNAFTPAFTPKGPSTPAYDSADPRAFSTTGPLVAEQQADIAAERDGRIVHVAVQIGDRVRRGQLLAALDDRSLRASYDSKKAKIASLEAQVNEWQAEQKSAEADLRRADMMRAEKIRSEEDWEHVRYKRDETIAEVARYRADKVAAQADLQFAALALEESRIVAPFDGVVGRSSLRLAQEVKKGDVMLWVTATGPLRVLFTVPESAMSTFSVGAGLNLTTPIYPELHQQARILRVSPVVDPASASVQVIGILLHASPLLKPGMTMQISAEAPHDQRSVR